MHLVIRSLLLVPFQCPLTLSLSPFRPDNLFRELLDEIVATPIPLWPHIHHPHQTQCRPNSQHARTLDPTPVVPSDPVSRNFGIPISRLDDGDICASGPDVDAARSRLFVRLRLRVRTPPRT